MKVLAFLQMLFIRERIFHLSSSKNVQISTVCFTNKKRANKFCVL